MSGTTAGAARGSDPIPPPPAWRCFSPEARAAAAVQRAEYERRAAKDRRTAGRWHRIDGRTKRLAAVFVLNLLLHALVLLAFGLILLPGDFRERIFTILSVAPEPAADSLFEVIAPPQALVEATTESDRLDSAFEAVKEEQAPLDFALNDLPQAVAVEIPTVRGPAMRLDTATSGRDEAAKAMLVERFGGSEGSELAVARGLKWLAKIQRKDGSWSFMDVGGAPGAGRVGGNTENGATASALLCFLGAGHTHAKEGPYKEVVAKGLAYLVKNGKIVPGGDYRGDIPNDSHAGMYIQGLAAIALAEAAAMADDRRLKAEAESAVTFILSAQHPEGGGWRYEPGVDGDTSVVGWQLMALKSAQAGGIRVPGRAFFRTGVFLDSVAADGGSRYGYRGPARNRPSTTAIGLLCRMYLGWGRDHEALKEGVKHLLDVGPSDDDMYYTYYATQVLHHYGGEEWERWNRRTRDRVVRRQLKTGAHAGSWPPGRSISGIAGGRLFETCLAIMTLEVYYRHLPLYDREKLKVEF